MVKIGGSETGKLRKGTYLSQSHPFSSFLNILSGFFLGQLIQCWSSKLDIILEIRPAAEKGKAFSSFTHVVRLNYTISLPSTVMMM